MTALRVLELVIGIGLAIMLHEFGHFVAARLARIKVLKFSIGFPPRLFGWTMGETEYVVQATPLGGYVKLSGEDWEETGELRPCDLMAKPWYTRIGVYAAGVVMNLILAWTLFVIVYARGIQIDTYPPVAGEVGRSGEAWKAGIRTGDKLVSVNGVAIANWYDFYGELDRVGEGKAATVVVGRDGVRKTVKLRVTTELGVEPPIEPVIGGVSPLDRAEKAGFRPGDRIVTIGGKPVRTWMDVSARISRAPEAPLAVRVRRGGKTVDIKVTPRHDQMMKRSFIGISPKAPMTVQRRFTPRECVTMAAIESFMIAREIPRSIWRVVVGKQRLKDVLGGPVMIVRLGIAKAEQGLTDFLHFLGVLNVSLLVVNLLPIPAVDGGMIVLAFLEGIRRRRFSVALYARLQQVGVALLFALLAFTLFNDISR
jgi:regulator of sigma E protease